MEKEENIYIIMREKLEKLFKSSHRIKPIMSQDTVNSILNLYSEKEEFEDFLKKELAGLSPEDFIRKLDSISYGFLSIISPQIEIRDSLDIIYGLGWKESLEAKIKIYFYDYVLSNGMIPVYDEAS